MRWTYCCRRCEQMPVDLESNFELHWKELHAKSSEILDERDELGLGT